MREFIDIVEGNTAARLCEGPDAPLFHFTDEWVLRRILRTGILGVNGRAVSLTRDTNHFFLTLEDTEVMLVLDGRRLRQDYRFVQTYGNIGDSTMPEKARAHGREAEERTDELIRPISRYLKEIVLNRSLISRENRKVSVERTVSAAASLGIPVTVGDFTYGKAWFRHRQPLDTRWVAQQHDIVESADLDLRFQNDHLTDDPDHKVIKDRGTWGSSHTCSSGITGQAADKMGIAGYRLDDLNIDLYGDLAHKKLAAILRSPGSKEPLYHGFRNRLGREWKVGEIIDLPLMATSGDMQSCAGYGFRDRDNKVEPPTVYEFPKGTRIVGYGKWKPEDAADFGYVWAEAITAGRFRIIGRREELYTGTWRKDVYMMIVRLEPVAYFDPDNGMWVPA